MALTPYDSIARKLFSVVFFVFALLLGVCQAFALPSLTTTAKHRWDFERNLSDTGQAADKLNGSWVSTTGAGAYYVTTVTASSGDWSFRGGPMVQMTDYYMSVSATPWGTESGTLIYDWWISTAGSCPQSFDGTSGSSRLLIAHTTTNLFTYIPNVGYKTWSTTPTSFNFTGRRAGICLSFNNADGHIKLWVNEYALNKGWVLWEDYASGGSPKMRTGVQDFRVGSSNSASANAGWHMDNVRTFDGVIDPNTISDPTRPTRYFFWYGNSLVKGSAGSGCGTLDNNGMRAGFTEKSAQIGGCYSFRGTNTEGSTRVWTPYHDGTNGISSTTGTGTASGSLIERFAANFPVAGANTGIILGPLGTNDDYPPYGPLTQAQTVTNYTDMIERAFAYSPTSPIFCVLDRTSNCSTLGSDICTATRDARNATIASVVATEAGLGRNVRTISINDSVVGVCTDNLHFTQAGHDYAGSLIAQQIYSILDAPPPSPVPYGNSIQVLPGWWWCPWIHGN